MITVLESNIKALSKAQAKYSPVDEATQQETQSTLSENIQYLAMYVYGLFKTTVVSPPLQIAPSSP